MATVHLEFGFNQHHPHIVPNPHWHEEVEARLRTHDLTHDWDRGMVVVRHDISGLVLKEGFITNKVNDLLKIFDDIESLVSVRAVVLDVIMSEGERNYHFEKRLDGGIGHIKFYESMKCAMVELRLLNLRQEDLRPVTWAFENHVREFVHQAVAVERVREAMELLEHRNVPGAIAKLRCVPGLIFYLAKYSQKDCKYTIDNIPRG